MDLDPSGVLSLPVDSSCYKIKDSQREVSRIAWVYIVLNLEHTLMKTHSLQAWPWTKKCRCHKCAASEVVEGRPGTSQMPQGAPATVSSSFKYLICVLITKSEPPA